MKKSPVSEYGFINAKLRARISTILTEDFTRGLIGTDNIEGAVQFLATQGFSFASDIWSSTGDIQSLEFEFFKNNIDNYKLIMKHTYGVLKDFTNVLSIKPEIENIKAALRLWYGSRIRKRPVSYRSAYLYKDRIYEKIDWAELINAVDYNDIKKVFQNTIYESVFSSYTVDDAKDRLFEIETALDRLYYRYLQQSSSKLAKSDKKIVSDILSTEIDLQNISWLIRYRHFYKVSMEDIGRILIPGGHGLELDSLKKNENEIDSGFSPVDILKKTYPELSALSISDHRNFSGQARLFEHLLDETRKRTFSSILAGYPFTIGIIPVYFFMTEREQRFISSVLNGKIYNFPNRQIEELIK